MLKLILVSIVFILLVVTLTGCSLSGYTLRHDVRQVLKHDFNGEIELAEIRTERKDGTPVSSGRQLVWLYDHELNQYLFFRFVDSEYTEYRELEANRTHHRHSRTDIRDMIAEQRDDLRARMHILRNQHQAFSKQINQPMFVHFGHTDRYRFSPVSHPGFAAHHPVYLNIALPTDPDAFLGELGTLLPSLQYYFQAHPNGRVALFPRMMGGELQSLFDQGYWVSDGPPEHSFLGSRPREALWRGSLLMAQPGVAPEPASARERISQNMTNEGIQHMQAWQAEHYSLMDKRGFALYLNQPSEIRKQLERRFSAAVSDDVHHLESMPLRVLHFLDREGEGWVFHFFAAERRFENPVHVRFNLTTNVIETQAVRTSG